MTDLPATDLRHRLEERRTARLVHERVDHEASNRVGDNLSPLEAELRELQEQMGDIQRAQ